MPSISPEMAATIFLAFMVTMAAVVVSLCARYLNGRAAAGLLVGLSVWFLYAGLLGYFGVFRNTAMRPPVAALLFVPVVVFLGLFIEANPWRALDRRSTLRASWRDVCPG